MILNEAFTHTLRLLCDHPRCRTEETFTAVGFGALAITPAIKAGWFIRSPGDITKPGLQKHYCPEHAAENRPAPHPSVDAKDRQGKAMASKGFPPTPPKKTAKKKRPKKSSGDLFD